MRFRWCGFGSQPFAPRYLLTSLVVAFAAGIGFADREWLRTDAAVGLACVATLGAMLVRSTGRRWLAALAIALAAGGVALGSRLDSAQRYAPSEPVEAVVTARVAAVDTHAQRVSLTLHGARTLAGPPLPPRLRLHLEPQADPPRAGSWIRAKIRARSIWRRCNPGRENDEQREWRRGVGATATLVHPQLLSVEHEGPSWRRQFEHARAKARARLVREGRGGGLLAALGLGAREGITREDRAAFARLGLSHLLAVSGLHVAMVAGAMAWLSRRAIQLVWPRADSRRLALAPALVLACSYAAATGFGIPVRRALIFLCVFAGCAALKRLARPGHVLALAAGVVLALEPAALFEPGAQLSFAATAALAMGLDAAEAPGSPAVGPRWQVARSLLATAALANAATAPIAALHFGTGAPVGWLSNLVAVPVTAFVLLPAALATSILAASGIDLGIAEAALGATAILDAVVRVGSATPAVVERFPSLLGLALAACLAIACIRDRTLWRRCALAAAAAAMPLLAPAAEPWPAAPRVVVFDVGQGSAALIQTRTAAVLVDAGAALAGRFDRGADILVPSLRRLGVERLDVLALSHGDLDHRGGAPAVLDAVPTRELWLPRGTRDSPAFASLRAAAARRGTTILERGLGDPGWRRPGIEIATLWPPAGTGAHNDRSLVLQLRSGGGVAVLLPGDLEASGEAALLASAPTVASDVLVLGHHGSRTSSGGAFLAAVSPRLAIASAPRFSRFGMPHVEVRERLAAREIRLAWTGLDGALVVSLAGDNRLAVACRLGWSDPLARTALRNQVPEPGSIGWVVQGRR